MSDTPRWFDATITGSQYEQQTSDDGRWRHRRLRVPFDPPDENERWDRGVGEWEPGPAPD